MLNHTFGEARFQVWGFAKSFKEASNFVVVHTLLEAEKCGVLQNIRKHKCVSKRLCELEVTKKSIESGEVLQCVRGAKGPSLFQRPKWKSREFYLPDQPPEMKWRDVISFSRHVFRSYARTVGRALQVLIKELSHRN